MKQLSILFALSVALTACTPQPAPPKPAPPLPTAAANPNALRLDVALNESPDGGLVAIATVVNTGQSSLQVGRELRLTYHFEPNDAGSPKFGGNPFNPAGQPGYVALLPAGGSTVQEQIVLAKPGQRAALSDGRLRVTAEVCVRSPGSQETALPMVKVMELGKPRSGVATSADAGR